MPLSKFSDFDSCLSAMTKKLGSRVRAKKYCGELRAHIELGKKPNRKKYGKS